MIRLIRLVKRREGVSVEAFAAFRRDQLGPFVAGLQTRLGITRYVQTHRGAGSLAAEMAFVGLRPGAGNGFDGVEEFWWPTLESCVASMLDASSPYAEVAAFAENGFETAATLSWLGVEYPQVSTSLSRLVASPRSGVSKLVFAISALPGTSAEDAQRYWIGRHGPLVRSFAGARGMLAYTQVHRATSLEDAPRPRPDVLPGNFPIGHAEAWFAEARPESGSDGLEAMKAAIADERNFIDWSRSSVLIGKEFVFVDRCWI